MNNFIFAYYQAIVEGTEVVGIWVRLLYEKIVAGIDDGTYIFDQAKANKAIRFIEQFCRHNKGKLAPGFLKLDLWEKAFISTLYGIVDDKGKRVFREIALFVGRKCGKTLIAAAIITYEAYADGEFGSEIYCLAPKLDQSDLVYSAFEFNVTHAPDLMKRIKKRKNDYFIQSTNTTIKKIAFNEKKADAKRLLSLMSLGATHHSELTFEIEGKDEDEAAIALQDFCRSVAENDATQRGNDHDGTSD